MSQFKVEKREIDVRILDTEGGYANGTVFLAPQSAMHTGPQTLIEILNDDTHFLPIKNNAGEFVLVGKAQISALKVAREDETIAEFARRIKAKLRLRGIEELDGELIVPEGPAAFRVSDYLNSDENWLRLEIASDLYWIRKSAVLSAKI